MKQLIAVIALLVMVAIVGMSGWAVVTQLKHLTTEVSSLNESLAEVSGELQAMQSEGMKIGEPVVVTGCTLQEKVTARPDSSPCGLLSAIEVNVNGN